MVTDGLPTNMVIVLICGSICNGTGQADKVRSFTAGR